MLQSISHYHTQTDLHKRFVTFGSECEHLCLLRCIILECFSVFLEWFPNSALQIFQCGDLGFYVNFLTVFHLDFQFLFGRIYLVTDYYSPQEGCFLKQYSYLKLCMYSFIKFKRAALLQYTAIYPLLCFPYTREKFPHWEDRFPPFLYTKGSNLNSAKYLVDLPGQAIASCITVSSSTHHSDLLGRPRLSLLCRSLSLEVFSWYSSRTLVKEPAPGIISWWCIFLAHQKEFRCFCNLLSLPETCGARYSC